MGLYVNEQTGKNVLMASIVLALMAVILMFVGTGIIQAALAYGVFTFFVNMIGLTLWAYILCSCDQENKLQPLV